MSDTNTDRCPVCGEPSMTLPPKLAEQRQKMAATGKLSGDALPCARCAWKRLSAALADRGGDGPREACMMPAAGAGMSAARLAEIEARVSEATPGPWRVEDDEGDAAHVWAAGSMHGYVVWDDDPWHPANAAFIAGARADVPDLLAEVRRLQALLSGAPDLGADAATRHDKARKAMAEGLKLRKLVKAWIREHEVTREKAQFAGPESTITGQDVVIAIGDVVGWHEPVDA